MTTGANARTVNVAAAQLCSGDNVERNLDVVDDLLGEAARKDCRLVVLPENVAFVGRKDHDKLAHAEVEGNGPIQQRLRDSAKKHALWIIAGSLPLKSGNEERCFGASMVFDPHGELRACYRKIHLFDVDLPDRDEHYRESASMMHGDNVVVVDTAAGRTGLSICYDVGSFDGCMDLFGEAVRKRPFDLFDGLAGFCPDIFNRITDEPFWQFCLLAGLEEMAGMDAVEAIVVILANGHREFHLVPADLSGIQAWLRAQHIIERCHMIAAARSEIDAEILGMAVCCADQPEQELRLEEQGLIFCGRVAALEQVKNLNHAGTALTLVLGGRRH
jgi:predicted amidohydrolase